MKNKKINIKRLEDDKSVHVRNESTASLTALSDDVRGLSKKEYKAFLRIVKLARRLDNIADKWNEIAIQISDARTLSNREWKQCKKLVKTLRKSDLEVKRAELIEKKARRERFEQAKMEVK